MDCVDPDRWLLFVRGALSADEQEAVRQHVGSCPECRKRYAMRTPTEVTGVTREDKPRFSPAEEAEPALTRGTSVGRYLILERIGSGGMGMVYSAIDPELDRRVAIKILRANLSSGDDARWKSRMQREAQAMARLSHQNVIAVYDVGTFDDRVFLAMELVEGGTLKGWLAAGPRGWREVLALFVGAGRGLAAAHRAGIVHRDFKPDNVLIDAEGRPRVTDFGLARSPMDAEETPRPVASPPGAMSFESPLTDAGTVMGTPGYMSPEQYTAQPTDERSDQFAFCASFFEALYGSKPFKGANFEQIVAAIRDGAIVEPPAGSTVPAWLRKVILRGLSADPDQRWPSLDELLDACAYDSRRSRTGWAAAGLALLAATGVLAVRVAQKQPPCSGSARRLEGVWDAASKPRVHDAILASGKSYAPSVWAHLERVLDRYATRWAEAHRDACEATRVHREQTEDVMRLRMACLDGRRRDLAALANELARADQATIDQAVQASLALPPIGACADVKALSSEVGPPLEPAVQARVDALRGRLADARALLLAGRYQAGLAVADPAAVEARALPSRAVEAESQDLLGRLRWKASDYTGASAALKRAIWAAEASRLDALKTGAAVALAVVSVDVSGFPAAHDWLDAATASLQRLGEPAELVIEARISTAMVLFRESRYAESEKAARDAIAIAERTFGRDDLRVAVAYRSLGDALNWQDRWDEALATFGHARTLTAKALGDGHPDVGVLLRKEADAYAMRKDGAGALERARQALAIFTASLAPGHLSIAQSHTNIAEALGLLGRHEEAIAEERLALATYERIFGAESENVGVSSTNIGYSLTKLGRYPEARVQLDKAVRIYDKTLAPGSVEVAEPLQRLGELELAAGKPRDAIAPLERALRLRKDDAEIARALERARASRR